jgi:hypothetical protein
VDWLHLDRDRWRARVHGSERLGSVKGREFVDYLSDF